MSKRFVPQHQGDKKRAKLDISISDHNFPLSQNKEPAQTDWGDEDDDEMLLQASQLCEEAYNANVSLLPDYSLFMAPGSSSTQITSSASPSNSKKDFTFKRPSSNLPHSISTNLREKCTRISSPLPGITAKDIPKPHGIDLTEDLIYTDKILKDQGSEQVYRQLLQLQEENQKLKSENGKLLDKCVTKEGEASILRAQMKTCQVAVDNARLDKIKAQEKAQMEWTEKLAAANKQLTDLKTQLDFKNLEIISVKEKCVKLESNKVRLTQVTVGNNDRACSSRLSSSYNQNESITQRRVKTVSNAIQTDDKAPILVLNKTNKPDNMDFTPLLSHILEPTSSPLSLLDYNEKLSRTNIVQKCRVYSTFHRVPASREVCRDTKNLTIHLPSIYEDIANIFRGNGDEKAYFNVGASSMYT